MDKYGADVRRLQLEEHRRLVARIHELEELFEKTATKAKAHEIELMKSRLKDLEEALGRPIDH